MITRDRIPFVPDDPQKILPHNIPLIVLPSHDCGYLPGRVAQSRGFFARSMPPELYHQLMDHGFRRSGLLVYRPACRGCSACQPIRVPVARFLRSASQRRVWKKNLNLAVEVNVPLPTDEKYDLYSRYLANRHNRDEADAGGEDSFVSFLYESPVDTIEMSYRDTSGKLVGVGICDRSPRSLSSVYFYFDPAERRRGLGTFAALWELEYARSHGMAYYYLGYYVAGCSAMSYKGNFRPHEILGDNGAWKEADPVG